MYDYSRRVVAEAMRLLYERGLVSAFSGNVSVRVGSAVVITPSGLHRARLGSGDVVVIGLDGRRIWGSRRPSSEWRMHTAIYRVRSDVGAVVHAHPVNLVSLTMRGRELRGPLELDVFFGGRLPLVEELPPGSGELASRVAEELGSGRAVILRSHGAVTVGRDVWEAEGLMEALEEAARMIACP